MFLNVFLRFSGISLNPPSVNPWSAGAWKYLEIEDPLADKHEASVGMTRIVWTWLKNMNRLVKDVSHPIANCKENHKEIICNLLRFLWSCVVVFYSRYYEKNSRS